MSCESGVRGNAATDLSRGAPALWWPVGASGVSGVGTGLFIVAFEGPTLSRVGFLYAAHLLLVAVFEFAGAPDCRHPGFIRAFDALGKVTWLVFGICWLPGVLQLIPMLSQRIGFSFIILGVLQVVSMILVQDGPVECWRLGLGSAAVVVGLVVVLSPIRRRLARGVRVDRVGARGVAPGPRSPPTRGGVGSTARATEPGCPAVVRPAPMRRGPWRERGDRRPPGTGPRAG